MFLCRCKSLRSLLSVCVLVALGACSVPMEQDRATAPTIAREAVLFDDRAVMNDGYELPLQRWLPEQEPVAIVLALHGFNDYHNAFATVGPQLASAGIATYAYDQRGFGATADRGFWTSADRMIDDARTMIELIRVRYPERPVYLLGESMGGAVSMAATTKAASGLVDGVVLVAPAVWARKTMPWYQRWALAVAESVAPGWMPSAKGVARRPSDNTDMLRALGRDPLMIKRSRVESIAGLADLMDIALSSAPKLNTRTLVLYGEQDLIVPKRPTCRMLQTLPPAVDWRLGLYPEGYHMLTRDLNGRQVVDDIAHWILAPQQPLPSGHQADRHDWDNRLCQQA